MPYGKTGSLPHSAKGKRVINPAEISTLEFHESFEGREFCADFTLTEAKLDQFIGATGDSSPLHVSDIFARNRGFAGRVVHGAYLTSLATSVVGTRFPGQNALIHSVQFRFHEPVHIGQSIQVRLTIEQASEAVKVIVVRAEIFHGETLCANGKIQVGFTHGQGKEIA